MISAIAHGQQKATGTGSVCGRIFDSASDENYLFTVVALLQPDSTLLQFTRVRKDGSWILRNIPAGNYYLLISHPACSDYYARAIVKSDSLTDMGMLTLETKADSLTAVVVTQRTPLFHIRGDTIEFNTANVKLNINATIEQLLNRLPGLVIDQNGGITYNGQKIQRLLLDGEDFFSSDPSIVTRNFNADMIAKVQILDKKSSQAEFTGIDDGQRTKTVNLVLKEDAKKGYFVKAEGGESPQGYYNVNSLLGSFKGRRQLAALALSANNGMTGFSEGSGEIEGELNVGNGAGDALGGSAGMGIPEVRGVGTHYSNKWDENENHVSGNASFGYLMTRPFSSSLTQQILPDSIYIEVLNCNSINRSDRQSLNADYDYLPDSVSAFRFSFGGTNGNGHDKFSSQGTSYFNDILVNASQNNISANLSNQSFQGNVMFRRRSRRKQKSNFSIVTGISTQSNTTNGYLYSVNNFYRANGRLLIADTTDQRKIIFSNSFDVSNGMDYTEPLWQNTILALSYGLTFDRSRSQQRTFDRGDGKYQEYVDSLSSVYQNDVVTQRATINIQSASRPFTYTIGGDLLSYTNRVEELLKDSVIKYRYVTFIPRVSTRYSLNNAQSVSFYYSGSTQRPSITQLQAVQNNNDPLHITLGNPNLHPSFSNQFQAGLNSAKVIALQLILNFGFATNSISTRTYTDSLGRQISQVVNVGGSQNGSMFFGLNHRLAHIGVDLGVNANLTMGRSSNYVGNLLSYNITYNTGWNITVGKYVSNAFSFHLSSNAKFYYSSSSVNAVAITRYWTQGQNVELSYFPLPGLEINTNCRYSWRQKTHIFDKENSTILWDAYMCKNFLSNRLAVRWIINDILGQNTGIGRSISANTVSETATNIIGRYWMLSATYRFERHGKLK